MDTMFNEPYLTGGIDFPEFDDDGNLTGGFIDIVNNIYDLNGNVQEWTIEARDEYYRIYRGGSCYEHYSPSHRDDGSYDSAYVYWGSDILGSRLALYVK